MSVPRKHHYVPKFFLKLFSGDGRCIDVFNIRTKRIFSDVGLKGQCQERYFYGNDPGLEKTFADLEGIASEVIKKIVDMRINDVTDLDADYLRQFILFQSFRTKGAAEKLQRFTIAGMKPIMDRIAESEGIPLEEIENLEFRLTSPQMWSLRAAVGAVPAVMDLQYKILVAPQNAYLLVSDSPVILYNQFAENHPQLKKLPGQTGMALKGLQIFLPISPVLCIALFDPTTYAYNEVNSPVGKMSKKDVYKLNVIQACNADKCLYWHRDAVPSLSYLNKVVAEAEEIISLRENKVEVGEIEKGAGGKSSQLILTHSEDIHASAKFNFVQVIERGDFSGLTQIPARSKELLIALKLHQNVLDEEARKVLEGKKGSKIE